MAEQDVDNIVVSLRKSSRGVWSVAPIDVAEEINRLRKALATQVRLRKCEKEKYRKQKAKTENLRKQERESEIQDWGENFDLKYLFTKL